MTTGSGPGAPTRRSPTTRERIRQKAILRGAERSDDIAKRVRAALDEMATEVELSAGAYPHNGGVVSMAEVARRAGIHKTTLHTAKQRALSEEVRARLEVLRNAPAAASSPARKSVATQRDEWKQRYVGLLQSHCDTEAALQQAEYERDQLAAEKHALLQENERLRATIAALEGRKVVTLRSRSK